MRTIDLTSWASVFATVLSLAIVTLIGVGIRLVVMMTIQQRRERANRQINERLRTLIAAYRVLGGSFTGDLFVDPTHLRGSPKPLDEADRPMSDRPRRIRDAVEAALSDIILLGTEHHVRLAARAAGELVAGRPVPTHDLVVALRDFIREALDLDPVPAGLVLPEQGPTRPGSGGGGRQRGGGDARGGSGGGGMMGGTAGDDGHAGA